MSKNPKSCLTSLVMKDMHIKTIYIRDWYKLKCQTKSRVTDREQRELSMHNWLKHSGMLKVCLP